LKQRATSENLLVHADDARPRAAMLSTQYFNENQMKSVPHPPYSPDLAPSNFYRFEAVNRCRAGLSFEDADQFLAAVEGVREGIEKVTLQTVFLEWMDRLRK
jgi:histone-lysine N-methyltransferase SETMAR